MSIEKCLENEFSPTRTVEIGLGKFFILFLIFIYGIIVFFNLGDLHSQLKYAK
jgi:hypothetical protein